MTLHATSSDKLQNTSFDTHSEVAFDSRTLADFLVVGQESAMHSFGLREKPSISIMLVNGALPPTLQSVNASH